MDTAETAKAIDLTRDLKELVGLAAGEQAERELLRRGLDWLARVAPYDLATVFLLEGQRLAVQTARGSLADERLTNHTLSLQDFPTIQEALDSRRARIFNPSC